MPTRNRKLSLAFQNRPYARGEIVRKDFGRRCAEVAGKCRAKRNRDRRKCIQLGTISKDPIGFAAGDANQYRYVGNGPTNATDPSGLEKVKNPHPPGTEKYFRWRDEHGGGPLRAAGTAELHSTNQWAYKDIQPTLVTIQDVSADALSLGLKNNYEIVSGHNPVRDCEVSSGQRAVQAGLTYGIPIFGAALSKSRWVTSFFSKADDVGRFADETGEALSSVAKRLPSKGSQRWAELQSLVTRLRNLGPGNTSIRGTNRTLAQVTQCEAEYLGRRFVGEGFSVNSAGHYISRDGTRLYRPPTLKPNNPFSTTGKQANFIYRRLIPERWVIVQGQWRRVPGTGVWEHLKNGHIDIID